MKTFTTPCRKQDKMKSVILASTLALAVVAHDETTVKHLDPFHESTGFVTLSTYESEGCPNSPATIEYFGLGECVRESDVSSYSYTLIKDSQFSTMFVVEKNLYSDAECSELASSTSELISKECDVDSVLAWTASIPSAAELGALGFTGVLESVYREVDACHADEVASHATLTISDCECQESGGSLKKGRQAFETTVMHWDENQDCTTDSYMAHLDCDATSDGYFGARNSIFTRQQCVGAAVSEFDVSFPESDGTGFVIIQEFPESDTYCNKTKPVSEVFAYGACVKTTFTNSVDESIYIKWAAPIPRTFSRTSYDFALFTDALCVDEAEYMLPLHTNCSDAVIDGPTGTGICDFIATNNDCNHIPFSPDFTFKYKYSFSQTFPHKDGSHDAFFKYYATSDDCRSGDEQLVTSAVIVPQRVCHLAESVSLTAVEFPQQFATRFDSSSVNSFTVSNYNGTCEEDRLEGEYTQPQVSCSVTSAGKGYAEISVLPKLKNKRDIPNDAIYALLILLVFVPVFFFVALHIGKAIGCGASNVPESKV